jgi:hypothetical protein
MNIYSKGYNWTIVLLLLFISSSVSTVLAVYYHGYVGLILMVTPCLAILYFTSKNSFFRAGYMTLELNKGMVISLFWYIVGIATLFLRGSTDSGFFIQVLMLPIFLFIGMVLAKNPKYKSLVTYLVIIFAVLNCLLVGGVNHKINARTLNDTDSIYNEAGSTMFWGLIGIMMPIFFAEIVKVKSKIIKLFLTLLSIYLIYQLLNCGYATPIALFIINLFLIGFFYFLRAKLFSKFFWRSLLIFILSILIAYYLMTIILQSNVVSQIDVKDRFSNFLINPLGGGYDSKEGVSRFTLMNFSWQSFLKNPLIGGGGNIRTSIYEGISGGHSSAIDVLAVLGLLGGGGAFIYFFFRAFLNAREKFKRDSSFYHICNLSVIATFFLGGIMNPYWEGNLLIFILLLPDIYKYQYINDYK